VKGWARAACVVTVAWLAASTAVAAYAFGTDEIDPPARRVLGPGAVDVRLDVEHSRFEPARIVVRAGTSVTFTVVNHDPIAHELIVGNAEVHARHASGTHGRHGEVPGEVSVAPGESATTTFELDSPGTVLFACHLPRHFEYGMVGEIVVKDP
jgi:uncharacterized cupredoxin-like copper-binding protein